MQDSTFLAFIIYVLSRIVKHSNLTAFLEQPFEPFPEGNDPARSDLMHWLETEPCFKEDNEVPVRMLANYFTESIKTARK